MWISVSVIRSVDQCLIFTFFLLVGCDDYISDMLPAQPDGFCSLQTHFASRLCIPVPEYTARGIRGLRMDEKIIIQWHWMGMLVLAKLIVTNLARACLSGVAMNPSS